MKMYLQKVINGRTNNQKLSFEPSHLIKSLKSIIMVYNTRFDIFKKNEISELKKIQFFSNNFF